MNGYKIQYGYMSSLWKDEVSVGSGGEEGGGFFPLEG